MPPSLTQKPGSASAFSPLNKLSANTDRPKSLRSGPSLATDAHAAKRRKTEAPSGHVNARFEPQFDDISDATSDRKSITEPAGSQEGASRSSSNLHFGALSEFQNIEGTRKRGRRKGKVQTTPLKVAEEVVDSDQDELARDDNTSNQLNLGGSQPLTRTPRAREHIKLAGEGRRGSILDGADGQFRPQTTKPSKPAGTITRTARAHDVDNSPDPLHSDPFYMTRNTESVQKPISSSLSTRGDIRPALPTTRPKTSSTISIRIKSAVCVPYHICPSGEEDANTFYCVLAPNDNETCIVVQSANDGKEQEYHWVGLDPSRIDRLHYAPTSRFLRIIRSNNISQNVGPTLQVECVDVEAAVKLRSWLQAKAPRTKEIKETEERADKMTAMWDHLASQVKAKREATSTSNAQFDTSRIVYKATEDLRDSPKETDALKSLPPSTRRMVTRARERHGVPSSPTPPPNVAYTRWSLQAENKGWDDNWKMPLQYKRTTVDKDDIPKLDEGEFLNDNLISFCLSYVQDKYKTSLGDRVFFHNSFFYEKLKMPGKSNINYEGVRSWTSKVDILSKDYIIVPVNEHHHWWVAIICHPGRLEPDAPQSLAEDKDQHSSNLLSEAASLKTLDASSSAQTIDVEMVDARPHRSSSSPEGATTAGMSSLSIDSPADADKAQTSEPLKTRDKRTVIDLSRESLAPQENLGASASVKRRSTGRRYDPDVPRIITLDSLGSAHSAACTHLKKYLVAEFKDKRKQDNFCDCGVYLIGYIMEFAKNPDAFINDILEKKPAEWPLNAPDLRATIRSKILQLQKAYQENQIAEKRKRAAEKRARISKENKPHTPNTGEFPNSPGEMTCDTPAPSSGVPSAAPSRLTSRAGSPIKSPSDLAIPDGRRAQAVTRPDSPDVAEMGSHSHRDEVSSAIQLDHRRPTKRSYDALVGERMSGESSETFQTRDIAGGAREKEQDRQPPSPATLTKAPQSQDLAMVPSAPSPSEEISKQLPGPTSASRKQSSASASSGAEIEEQLKVEVLQAAEKVNGNRRLLSSARETFQDPVFLEKLPDSSPMSLPQVSPTRTPRRSPRQTKEVIVDILSVSSKEASRRGFRRLGDGEDDPVVLDDAGEPKPPATPRRGSKRNSKSKQEDDNDELVELPATPELELSMKRTSTQRTGGNDATWSSGSRNFPPAGLSKVSQPSTATRNPYKSPIGRPSKKTTAVLAPRHSSPKAPIDLTEDD